MRTELAQPVKEAVPTRTRELTSGNVPRQMLSLAIPSSAEIFIHSIVRLLDTYWMGRVGSMAIPVVAMGTTLRLVLISPMMGLSMGGMAVVARYVGARDQEMADNAVMQCLLLIMLFTVPITIIGYQGFSLFLRWMGATGEVMEGALAYLRTLFLGLFFLECLPTMSGIIRGAGRPEYTLRINVLNVVVLGISLPILALGWGPAPALGVRGAALGSLLGAMAGCSAVFYVLLTGHAGVRLRLRHLRPDLRMMWRILRISIPNSMERFSPNLGAAGFMALVSALGPQVLTAYSIFHQLWGFFQAITMGAGNAAATMMGQNLGAGKPERSQRAAYVGATGAAALSLFLYSLVALAATPIVGLFDSDPAVIALTAVALGFAVPSVTGRGWGQVLGRALGGAGDAVSPMLASIVALWAVQIPACWLLSRHIGPSGIWISIILGDLTHAVAVTARFRQGRWKLRSI